MVEYGTRGELGGVHFEFEGFIMVWLPEDRVGGSKVNKAIKGRGAFRGPDKRCSFLEEV